MSKMTVVDRLITNKNIWELIFQLHHKHETIRFWLGINSSSYASLQHELWRHSRIEVHQGKTQLWNKDGVMPSGCEAMTIAARAQDENAIVWRGDHELPVVQQGVKLLGTPLGRAGFVEDQLAKLSVSHSVLFERIQAVTDLQVAWLLLVFCAASRANYYLRVVHPRLVHTFAEHHDAAVWRCLQGLLGIAGDGLTLDLAQLPFHWGGLGLRSAVRSSCAAHWAELGGQLAHDSEETPCCSPVDHRPADQPVRWLPLERREHQPRASDGRQFCRSHVGSDR